MKIEDTEITNERRKDVREGRKEEVMEERKIH
jgi:hypothetical protein